MSETKRPCPEFEEWLSAQERTAQEPAERQDAWRRHRESCDDCERQWQAHQLLAGALGDETVPALSPGFQANLRRELAAETEREVRKLSGWRLAAMLAYVLAAGGLLAWALQGVPMPAIDWSSPWWGVVAFAAVPLSLLLAIGASRWLPSGGAPGQMRALSF